MKKLNKKHIVMLSVLLLSPSLSYAKCKTPYINDVGFALGNVESTTKSEENDSFHKTTTSGSSSALGVSGEHCVIGAAATDMFLTWGVATSDDKISVDVDTRTHKRRINGKSTAYQVGIRWKW